MTYSIAPYVQVIYQGEFNTAEGIKKAHEVGVISIDTATELFLKYQRRDNDEAK